MSHVTVTVIYDCIGGTVLFKLYFIEKSTIIIEMYATIEMRWRACAYIIYVCMHAVTS
jgi:hypothetical protein